MIYSVWKIQKHKRISTNLPPDLFVAEGMDLDILQRIKNRTRRSYLVVERDEYTIAKFGMEIILPVASFETLEIAKTALQTNPFKFDQIVDSLMAKEHQCYLAKTYHIMTKLYDLDGKERGARFYKSFTDQSLPSVPLSSWVMYDDSTKYHGQKIDRSIKRAERLRKREVKKNSFNQIALIIDPTEEADVPCPGNIDQKCEIELIPRCKCRRVWEASYLNNLQK